MRKTYSLKLRHTGSPNIGGGSGPMVNEGVSMTLATGQDQTFFVEKEDGLEEYTVRRLTPVECERLQGFPDGWTDIGLVRKVKDGYAVDESKETLDSHRYKALGNSMAVPVMAWIGERIAAVEVLG